MASSVFESLLDEITKTTPVSQQSNPKRSPSSSVESVQEQLNKKVMESLQTPYNEAPPTEDVITPEDDVSTARKLAFGMAEASTGSLEAEAMPWMTSVPNYLIVNHPELASRMGLTRPDRGLIKEPTSFMDTVLNAAHKMATSQVESLVSLFGSNEAVAEMDKYIQEKSFGKEWFDMEPDARRKYLDDQVTAQLKKDFPEFYDNPKLRESAWVTGGNIAASLLSPETLIAPAATTYKAAAAIGAGWGAADMALLDLAKTGKIEPMHVAGGATFGAIFAPLVKVGVEKGIPYTAKKTGEFFDKTATRMRYNEAEKLLDRYELAIAREVKGGSPRGTAILTAKGALSLDNKMLDKMYTITGRTRNYPKTREAANEFVSSLEERAGWWRQNKIINQATTTLNEWTVPIIDRMSTMAPKIAHEMRGVDFRTHLRTHTYFERVKPWLSKFNKLSDADKVTIKKLLSADSHESFFKASRMMYEFEKKFPDKYKGFSEDWRVVKGLLKEVADEYNAKGYKLDPLDYFFPRVAKYPKDMTRAHVGLFHKLTSEAAEKKGAPLSSEELGLLMRNTFSRIKKEGGKAHSSGHLRGRTVDEVTDFLEPYYADPVEALHSYLRMASNDLERMAFFQKFGLTKKERLHIDAIDAAIPKDIDKLASSLSGLDKVQQEQVADMLRARFTTGESSPHRGWQMFKNMGYTLTIFNPYSAMTQLGDLAFPMFKYGIRETAKAIFTKGQISKSDLGLTDAMEELFANTTKTKKTMDFFAKYSGFSGIDRFGKETTVNAALNTYQKLAKTSKGAKEIAEKWGRYFEGDTPKLIRDLHDGRITDNVKLLVWHELADIQPIALSEMPQKYLDKPNMRVMYMLKSFLIKQISFVRRQIVGELQQNNTTKGLLNATMFAGYWNLVGGSIDALKNLFIDELAGTDTPIEISDMMVENTLQMMGINKYHTARFGQVGPITTAVDFFMPPIPFIDDLAIAAVQDKPEQTWKAVPWAGPVMTKVIQANKKQKERISRYDSTSGRDLSPREKKARRKLEEYDYGF